MRSYRVNIIFVARELLEFIDQYPNIKMTIEAIPEEQEAAVASIAPTPRHQDTDAIYTPERGPRRKRTSKVNEAILNTIMDGHGDLSSLKAALEQAGMSAASLSTGLAVLQKRGQISRAPDGLYVSTQVREAAE